MYCLAASGPPGTGACWFTAGGVYIAYGIAAPVGAVYARTDTLLSQL